MSRREIKVSPDDPAPYRCGKEMNCYLDGKLVGFYLVAHGQILAAVDAPNKPTNSLGFNTFEHFKTQKAAKEWIISQLSQ